MSFDPEKVERIGWYYADAAGDDGWWPRIKGEMEDPALTVRASDYDKLLALYREAAQDIAQQSKELEFADECLAIKVGAKQ